MIEKISAALWYAAATTFAIGVAGILALILRGSQSAPILGMMISLGVIMLAGQDRLKNRQCIPAFPFISVPLVGLLIWASINSLFGSFDFDAVLYHLRHGVNAGGLPDGVLKYVSLYALFLVMVACGLAYLAGQSLRVRKVERLLTIPALALNPLTIAVVASAGGFSGSPPSLTPYYVSPLEARLVAEKPLNVIHIFLESNERTFSDKALFGDVMEPYAQFRERGIELTDLREAARTNWTIAGQVASNCGVPLIQPWFSMRVASEGATALSNKSQADDFMPNAVCLAELVSDAGYRTHFVSGANLKFAGTNGYARRHGYIIAEGVNEIPNRTLVTRTEWGYHDDVVLDRAEQLLDSAIEDQVPYLMTITLLAGHGPDGHIADACLDGRVKVPSYDPKILQAMDCTNELVRLFLQKLEAQGHLDNTIVIIQSDHLMMKTSVSHMLDTYDRRNFLIAFGPGLEPTQIDKPAAMFDVYPTILEAIGFELPGSAAGLGRSLISTEPTLTETLGIPELDNAIISDTILRRFLWNIPSAETVASVRE